MNIAEFGANSLPVAAKTAVIHSCTTIEAAFAAALTEAQKNDRIIVYGSFYTVAKVMLTVA